jgi:cell fate regulator YaaT (PSP1 superfamily)
MRSNARNEISAKRRRGAKKLFASLREKVSKTKQAMKIHRLFYKSCFNL